LGKKGAAHPLIIPHGFEFESSVPRGLRWVLSPDDPRFLKAAAVHDWLLENGYQTDFADSQWRDAARSDHAPRWKRAGAFFLMRLRRLIVSNGKNTE